MKLALRMHTVGVVRLGLDLDDQLQLVLRVAGFGQVDHIPLVIFATFLTVSRFPIVGRLQAAGFQFFSGLGTQSCLVDSATFSRDGRAVITTGDDRMVRLWDVTTYVEFSHLGDQTSRAKMAALSPKGIGHKLRISRTCQAEQFKRRRSPPAFPF